MRPEWASAAGGQGIYRHETVEDFRIDQRRPLFCEPHQEIDRSYKLKKAALS
jgi:hypothetical protein